MGRIRGEAKMACPVAPEEYEPPQFIYLLLVKYRDEER
jgi:hypothetical protein